MTEERKIIRIEDAISAISNQQIAIEAIVDSDLGFKMWGGKDADGAVTKWLAKDKPIQVTTAKLTGGTTTGSLGLMTHDTNGLLAGQVNTLAEINAIITDATLFGEEDFDANTILKADSDDTPIALTVPEQTLVGRITAGNIDALSIAEVITLLDITLDEAYNTDGGAATIDVDAGDLTLDITGAYFHKIDLTNTTSGTPNGDARRGFKVFNAADFFKVVTDGSTIDLDAELQDVEINAAGDTALTGAANLVLTYPNIDLTSGALTLKGTASIITEAAENLTLLPGAGGYTAIGDGTAGVVSTNDDLYVTGDEEVDGRITVADITMTSNMTTASGKTIGGGGANGGFMPVNTFQTVTAIGITPDPSKNIILINEKTDFTFDFSHAAQTDPSLFIHSANQSTTEWLSLAHDQTDGLISSGTGLKLTSAAATNINLLPGAGGYTEVGTGGSPGVASGNDDLYVNGVIEGDSSANIAGNISIGSNQHLTTVVGVGAIKMANTFQTVNAPILTTGTTGNHYLMCEIADYTFDFAHAQQTNPTLFIQSANQSATEWGSIAHDQTDFVINSGAGTVKTPTGRSYNVTTVNAATYDLLITDHIVHVTYTVTGAVTSLTLPSAQVLDGRVIHIVDGGGNASANNITIDTQGAETISGAATLVIDNDYESYSLYAVSSNWYIY